MPKKKPARAVHEGFIPLLDIEGTTYDAGVALGHAWAEALRRGAALVPPQSKGWWQDRRFAKLIDRHAAHLPDLYRGMAKGAGVPEDKISTRAPAEAGGCTSFALHPRGTLDGQPISGQTKDTPFSRLFQFQVLRLKLKDAPSALTLTYEGWLFGHGFVRGGCAVFRNSLWAGDGSGLPMAVWGMLALHCKTVGEVIELTRRHGVAQGMHSTVADEHGGIVGIEAGRGGVAFLNPAAHIYAHANCVVSRGALRRHESCPRPFVREDSEHRGRRLRELLLQQRGRLTAQLCLNAMSDHEKFPTSICRHESSSAMTCAAVVVEPTRGLLHAVRGQPCQNWPRTYRLD